MGWFQLDMPRWKTLTTILILAGVAVYIVYDIVVYLKGGVDATESVTVGTWLQHSLWVCLCLGLLVGHLMVSGKGPDPVTWKHFAVLLAGIFIGLFCTKG